MTEDTAPLLPAVPVDFNALHASLEAGDAPEVAAEKGISALLPPEPKEEKQTRSKRAAAGADATTAMPETGAASE